MKNRLQLMAFVVVALLVGAFPAQATVFEFDLLGKAGPGLLTGNEHPTVPSSGGSGGEIGAGITFDDVTLQLNINIAWGSGNGFTDLTGNASAGHIHQPTSSPAPGSFSQATGVLFDFGNFGTFNNSATNGGFTGSIVLNSTQAQQLFEGRLYINIHTPTNGPGEIRGNMVVPEPATSALIAFGVGALLVLGARRGRHR